MVCSFTSEQLSQRYSRRFCVLHDVEMLEFSETKPRLLDDFPKQVDSILSGVSGTTLVDFSSQLQLGREARVVDYTGYDVSEEQQPSHVLLLV